MEMKPIELSETLPSINYTSSEIYEKEKELIFSNSWQYICNLDYFKNEGDYFLTEIAENPIIVIKEKDTLKGYYNVCKHRAGPLALKNGNCKLFKCKYHGWTYNLSGDLIGTPEFDGVKNFSKENYGLKKINVEVWENLVFINLAEKEKFIPIEDVFKNIKERIKPIDLKTKKFHTRIEYLVKSNWKVYVDNYLEGYHLVHVHPSLSNLLNYQEYTTELYEYYSLQYSPFKEGSNIYQENSGEAFYYFVYPNFMLNILPNRLQTNLVVPIDENNTKVIFDYYYDNLEELDLIKNDLAYSDEIQQEDILICENVQKGLKSKAYDKGRFSVKRETGVYHFQSLIKKHFIAE